jgi:hypothetical protein
MNDDRMQELLAAEAELKCIREKKAARAKKWYAANREHLRDRYAGQKAKRKAYYEANKERILAAQRSRYYEKKAIVVLAPKQQENTTPQ